MNKTSFWIVDDDRSIRWVLEKALNKANISCTSFSSASAMLSKLKLEKPEAIITDVRMDGLDGIEMMNKVHEQYPDMPVIVMTAHSDLDSAVQSYQGGAFEYLPKPFDVVEAVELASRAIAHSREKSARVEVEEKSNDTEIIGEAPAMQEVFRAIGRLSQSNITVLINGESGTGKELVAQALHRHSPRRDDPFIALNMAAIPKDLMESELFGHEKGSFTGAQSLRRGRFEQANGGTLFLDEIGDMPHETQTRLLRVLADGEFYRVGGHSSVKVDVRIIAATHQDLEKMVEEGRFREDLFHRINVIRIHLPKLSHRREDIPKLLQYFLKEAAVELKVESKALSNEAEVFLVGLEWPGNVRQLQNICRWLTVMASGREVLISDLPPELLKAQVERTPLNGDWQQSLRYWAEKELADGHQSLLDEALPAFERIMIEAALKHTAGRKKDASIWLGWGRNTLTRKIKELGVEDSQEDED
ncbi:MAG: nitrogen regulation protein NR(I) [Saccharospirillaceae bacterium]|nr:nitrogen regulation protein NR(I) [Pseudomonadales bacterium]NRB79863.1 nitrogen regulation protein NR(I) [Saccharospirillaceae bacterium]